MILSVLPSQPLHKYIHLEKQPEIYQTHEECS